MASLSFEGETQQEIVLKVKRWLQSVEGGEEDSHLSPVEAVERVSELTKDALRVIASAAPQPIAENELVKSLTGMGYKATEQTKQAVVASLDSLEEVTGGSLVKQVEKASRNLVYEMNLQVAKQLLKAMRGS